MKYNAVHIIHMMWKMLSAWRQAQMQTMRWRHDCEQQGSSWEWKSEWV